MTNVQIDRITSVEEPGGNVAAPASTLTIIEGTGIVVMTFDSNATTGTRRRIDDIRRILTSPGGRLTITMDTTVVVDVCSADYSPGGTTSIDFAYGPRISCEIAEVSAGRLAFVRWRAEYRVWSNVADLHPIVGFVCVLKYDYDRTGYLTLNRSGVLTVRRSAAFPVKLDTTSLPRMTSFTGAGVTIPYGGGQSPTASGVPTTLGNNPDLYRRFVCGPVFENFIRENQNYYVDESLQKLVFSVTDRQTASSYPSLVTEANVTFSYRMSLAGGPSVIQKQFSAELYGKPKTSKSELLAIGVAMSKNRIDWTGDPVRDIIEEMEIREPDMMNKNGIIFEIRAMGTNLGFPFTPAGFSNPFLSIMTNVPTGGSTTEIASNAPDAYGLTGQLTLTDFVYAADPPGTHVSPNTTGASLMGKTDVQAVVAQITPGTTIAQMEALVGGSSSIPAGEFAPEASEAPFGYFRVEGSMRLSVDNKIIVANCSPAASGDRIYQDGKPVAILHETISVQRKDLKPSQNIAFAPIGWAHVELSKWSGVSPPWLDANGNPWYTAVYERWCRILSPSMVVTTETGIGSVVQFSPATLPTPPNPQIKQPISGVSPIPPSALINPNDGSVETGGGES